MMTTHHSKTGGPVVLSRAHAYTLAKVVMWTGWVELRGTKAERLSFEQAVRKLVRFLNRESRNCVLSLRQAEALLNRLKRVDPFTAWMMIEQESGTVSRWKLIETLDVGQKWNE